MRFAQQLSTCAMRSIDLPIRAGTEGRDGPRGERERGGGCFTPRVAVAQLRTISARAADLPRRTMEPRAPWNLRARPPRAAQVRAAAGAPEKSSLPLQLATRFSF